MKYSAIILAAGIGSRMKLGYNKMFYKINEQPLISLSPQIFLNDPLCHQLIYVVNEEDIEEMTNILNKYELLTNRCKVVKGGSERQHSVYNGLRWVDSPITLVHDAARPFITQSLISSLVMNTKKYGCSIPGVKVKNTIKVVENDFVKYTLPREQLIAVQTPQACNTNILKKAHQLANKDRFLGTDEASLIEEYDLGKVSIVSGSYDNIKITTQEDIIFAEQIFNQYY